MPEETPHTFAHARRAGTGPGALVRELHEQGPVNRIVPGAGADAGGAPVWLVTGHREVRRVLGDHTRFGIQGRFSPRPLDGVSDRARPREVVGHLMAYDPPEHTRLRGMLTSAFTARRLRRLQPAIETAVEDCLDDMEDGGPPADLMELFAWPVSGAALCELIGVPRDDRHDVLRWIRWQLDEERTPQQRAVARDACTRYLGALVGRRRAAPDEGFIGSLVREHGDEFTDEELRGTCAHLFAAGLDNAAGMIGLGVLALLEHPEQLAAVRQDASAADRVTDELLRYLSVVHAATPRIATEDVTLGDRLVRAGDRVICSIPMANRDPALAPDADRLDAIRDPVPHVAFGHGVHHCIGAALARLELRTAYLALLRRFPGLRLAVPAADVKYRADAIAYGVEGLPVAW